MAKDDQPDRVKRETTETNGKIAHAFEKLATKLREKSQKADEKVQAAAKKGKQEALRRRSELFGQSANELEDKVSKLRKTAA